MRHTTKESKGSKVPIVYVNEAGIRGGANARLKRFGGRGRGRMGRYRQPREEAGRMGDVQAMHIHGVAGVTLGRRGLGDEAHVKGGGLAKRKTKGNIVYFGPPPTHGEVHLHRIRTIGGRRYHHRLGNVAGFGAAKAAALAAREAARAARTAAAAAATMARG